MIKIYASILFLSILTIWIMTLETPAYAESESGIENAIVRADEAKAKQIAAQCVACHSVEEGAREVKLGPNLWGIIGRPIASYPDYDYSVALSNKKGVWGSQELDDFLRSPNDFASGTKMLLPGITDLNTRGHLIRYLHLLSANPTIFDASGDDHGQTNKQTAVVDPFGETWPAGKGRELAGYACSSCHSLAIVKQQGQTSEGWSELIDWMVDEQGMSELKAEDRAIIVDYLSANFNVDTNSN